MTEPRTKAPSVLDRSLSAIRYRAEQSILWSGTLPLATSDAIWAAVQDRQALLDLLDLSTRSPDEAA